jgi:hypothetical protein
LGKLRRGSAALVAALSAALGLALVAPAQAFEKTANADGSFDYFFAAPSLAISSAGALDLGGLNFIEGVAGGFHVGASFNLDAQGGELAIDAAGNRWLGLDVSPRSLSIVAGGNLALGATRVSLPGGTLLLAAGGVLDLAAASFAVGAADAGGAGAGIIIPGASLPIRPGTGLTGGGTLQIEPGGAAPVPEPCIPAMLLAGLLLLTGVARRRRRG